MIALLYNIPVFHNQNQIRVLYSGQSMRYNETGSLLSKSIHCLLRNKLRPGIYRARSFVQNKHGTVEIYRSGKSKLLFFSAGKIYGACVYIDADGSRQDRPGYANDIALQVDEWRRENGIPFDKSTIAASPSEVDGGEFDTMDEALRYLYTCLNFPDSVLC